MFLLIVVCVAEKYPLLLGVTQDTIVPEPSALGVPGVLPDNVCVVVIDQKIGAQIEDVEALKKWGDAFSICEGVGKVVEFPDVDSNIFNVMKSLNEMYESKMEINGNEECLCKLKKYMGGLLIVRLPDAKTESLLRVRRSVVSTAAMIFVASTQSLFELPK